MPRKNDRQNGRLHHSERESPWISFTDMMSGLLIIFVLVITITLYDTQNAYEEHEVSMKVAEQAIEEKEAAIMEKNKVIEELIGIKSQIIEELLLAFKDTNLDLEIDKQTGAIRFSGGVFFETNSSTVSTNGRQYLEEFIPQYIKILLSDAFRDEVSQIIVEGHTDTVGGYIFNLKLSQDRAFSVIEVVLNSDFPKFLYQENLESIITANGRSYSEPILNDNGIIDPDKSRRVEFKFRLKDELVLEKLQGLMVEDGE